MAMDRIFGRGTSFSLSGGVLFVLAMITYLLLYTPAVVMGIMSFNASAMPILPFKGFTTYWYQLLLKDDFLLTSLKNSLIVGLPSAAISTLLGAMAAFGIVRHKFRFRNQIITISLLPFIAPRLILAVGLLCFFSLVGWKGSLLLIILGHVMLTIPISFLFTTSRLIQFPNHVEDAAANLGASPIRVFIHVTLPIIMPALVASFFFSFCTSFDEVLIAFFSTGKDNTLPIHIWATLQNRMNPQMVALATVLSIITAVITIFMWGIMVRSAGKASKGDVAK
jgi:spermidine/putrescine transport system permease protein